LNTITAFSVCVYYWKKCCT